MYSYIINLDSYQTRFYFPLRIFKNHDPEFSLPYLFYIKNSVFYLHPSRTERTPKKKAC